MFEDNKYFTYDFNNQILPAEAEVLLDSGLFSGNYYGMTTLTLDLIGSDFFIVFPRVAEVRLETIYWQKEDSEVANDRFRKSFYIKRENIPKRFLGAYSIKPYRTADILKEIPIPIAKKLIFYLPKLPA